jgi:hypothetical protein
MTDDGESSPFNLTFSGVRVITAPSDHFLEAEWQTMSLAPLWVFEAVAGVDDVVDDKERSAFMRALEHPPAGVLTAFVFSRVRREFEALGAARAKDPRAALRGIAEVATLLLGYPDGDDANAFRSALVDLALAVGGASGGLLGLGHKLSDAEESVIAHVRALLQAPPPPAR